MALLLTDCIEQIGTITLNNPERRNCLSNALLTELVEALAEFERRRVRAVVIRAASGSKVWSRSSARTRRLRISLRSSAPMA